MALPPKFNGHRLVFGGAEQQAVDGAASYHTLEIFLDYVCPFSAKLFKTFYNDVAPKLRDNPKAALGGGNLQVIFRQQIQPWHPSSTLTHEAGVAVLQLAPAQFWPFSAALFARQTEYFDVNVVNETRNATYKRLADLAASSTGGEVKAEDAYALLAVPDKPAQDGSLNVGNKVTNDLKVLVKMARLVGVHVSPTVIYDGVVANDISSSWTAEQWLKWLEEHA